MEHKIIVVVHFPSKGIPRNNLEKTMESAVKSIKSGFPEDYIVMCMPHKLEEEKVIVEVFNTENAVTKLEELGDLYDKFIEMENYFESIGTAVRYNL